MNKEKEIFDEYGNYDFPTDAKQQEPNTATSQIEEMAVMVCRREPKAKTIEECRYCTFKGGACIEYDLAEVLYNAGYRKVGDDEIVLSFKQTQEYRQAVAEVKFMKDTIRKETVKEILSMIKSDFYSIGDGLYELTSRDIAQLAKKYGVEVEEWLIKNR